MTVRSRAAALVVTLALVVAAGCGGHLGDLKLSEPPTVPPTTTPSGPATTVALPAGCDPNDATRSLRPQGALPSAGHMPAGTYMATIQARGKLVAGVDQTTLLFGYRDSTSGQIVGFDIDMLKEVAKAIFGEDGHLELKTIKYSERVPKVVSGEVDIVADTMTINCRRWARVAFSSEYYRSGQKILVPKDSPATSIRDLDGKKVCAAAGSTSVDNVKAANPQAVVVQAVDQTDCLTRLQRSEVDAISTDDTILAGLAFQDHLNTKILPEPFSQEPYGMAMPLDHPDFVRFVNGVLEAMRVDGRWKDIHTVWLSSIGIATPEPPLAEYRD